MTEKDPPEQPTGMKRALMYVAVALFTGAFGLLYYLAIWAPPSNPLHRPAHAASMVIGILYVGAMAFLALRRWIVEQAEYYRKYR